MINTCSSNYIKKQLWAADSIMDSHTTGPRFKMDGYGTLSTELLTDYHNNRNIKKSIRSCVEGRERTSDFLIRSDPRH